MGIKHSGLLSATKSETGCIITLSNLRICLQQRHVVKSLMGMHRKYYEQ